ncbi:MAG TPA: AraC family transcriptional regulator [Candidatus Baltobacteraceae bacterium]|nr:AraC family transcriptional regulator [Candidatus Baltobacteraceae bacterium]
MERPAREIGFRIWRTSRDRGWRGFEATIYDATDGYSDEFIVDHSVSMHVGTPVLVSSRCDGAAVHRLQLPGDVKVIPAGYSRVWEISAATRKLVVDLAPWFLRQTAEEMAIDPDRVALVPQLYLTDAQIQHLGWAFVAELESAEHAERLYAESLGVALAAHLLRRYSPAVSRRETGLPRKRLRRVVDHVREHIARDLSLAELASVGGVSPSHFKAQFKVSTGMPVHQYVIRMRVDYALELLKHTAMPIVQVALQAGFSNQSHLSRHVRRLHGITPAQIRRESQ